jgi:cell division protein ZapD
LLRFVGEWVRIPEFSPTARRGVITYEYPLNERIRTLLRLEDLFDKIRPFPRRTARRNTMSRWSRCSRSSKSPAAPTSSSTWCRNSSASARSCCPSATIPTFPKQALSGALYEIEQASAALLAMQGKIGHYLRENEWLMSIKSRAAIPGGVCEFDLPSYHYWLPPRAGCCASATSPAGSRRCCRSATGWPSCCACCAPPAAQEAQTAPRGTFQLMLGGRSAQLIRLKTGAGEPCLPEISAGKFAVNIRFLRPDMDQRPRQIDSTVNFELTLCNL